MEIELLIIEPLEIGVSEIRPWWKKSHLIFIDFSFFEFRLSLFLKGDDDQGHENVDEEEGEDDEVDDVEDGHFSSVACSQKKIN